MSNTVFCFYRVADDHVAGAARAGVVPETDQFWEFRDLGNQGNIVEVENTSTLCRSRFKFFLCRVVGGEHDVFATATNLTAQYQFGDRTAIEAEFELFHDLQNAGVG